MTTKASAYPCSAVPAYRAVVGVRRSLITKIFHDANKNKVLNIYSNYLRQPAMASISNFLRPQARTDLR
jgi:hypothetical protein